MLASFARSAAFIHSLARSLTYSEAHRKEVFVYRMNASISYSFSPLRPALTHRSYRRLNWKSLATGVFFFFLPPAHRFLRTSSVTTDLLPLFNPIFCAFMFSRIFDFTELRLQDEKNYFAMWFYPEKTSSWSNAVLNLLFALFVLFALVHLLFAAIMSTML